MKIISQLTRLWHMLRRWFSFIQRNSPPEKQSILNGGMPSRAGFLVDNAHVPNPSDIMTTLLTDVEARAMINDCVMRGDNTMLVMTHCRGSDVRLYDDFQTWRVGGEFNPAQVAMFRRRLRMIADAGLAAIPILFDDDSGLQSISLEALYQHAKRFSEVFDMSQFPAVVLGIETDEWLSAQKERALTAWLHGLYPRMLGHYTHGAFDRVVDDPYLAGVALEFGWHRRPQEIADTVRRAVRGLPGKLVIAAEYSKSSETEGAKLLGDMALAAGAVGAWTGSHAK